MLVAGALLGAGVEKKVRPLEVVALYGWMGGRPGRAVGWTAEVADVVWTGLGEWARMTHPPRKLITLAIPIQYRRIFLYSFIFTSLAADDGNLTLAVDLDQAMILQVEQ
jgi:hypothetical protein